MMQRIFIFGGTTEGRLLCDFLEQQQIPSALFVATAYGLQPLQAGYRWVQVYSGRLEITEMMQLLQAQQPKLVIDATHPYATVVTAHLQQVCQTTAIQYVRLTRLAEQVQGAYYFAALEDLMGWLGQTEGIIFSALGSKALPMFRTVPHYQQRFVVRVLPNQESLAQCAELGLKGRQIIAAQGPFSEEMNRLMFQEWQASILLTKESGKAGGFQEKIKAAQQCGLKIAVLQRPQQESGCTLTEVKQKLLAF